MVIDDLDGFQIQLATNEDQTRVIHLLKQVAQWMKDKGINQWRFLLEGGDDDEIKQAIADHSTYIVLNGSELIATFTLLPEQSEWDQHIWGETFSSNDLYLHRLAVVPPHMRKGLGSSILNWIQSNARRKKQDLKLDCVAENTKLNIFYKSNSFELVGITDGHSKWQKGFG